MIPKAGQNLVELGQLLRIYKKVMREAISPPKILEVGTHEGGTLYWWLQHAPEGANVLSIDIQRINSEYYRTWAKNDVEITWCTSDSASSKAINCAEQLAPFDFIFIDGDHSYEGVKSDWENYYPMLKASNSVIAFHDILERANPYIGDDGKVFPVEVAKLWQEICKIVPSTKREEIIEPHPEWGLGPGIGVIYS